MNLLKSEWFSVKIADGICEILTENADKAGF
jgi:hypothetical protein